jgi:hypothetical protein
VRLLLALIFFAGALQAQVQELSSAQRKALGELKPKLVMAQRGNDPAAVRALVAESLKVLGEQAGLPEVEDVYRATVAGAPLFAAGRIAESFGPYADHIEKIRWWKVGLDPSKLNHALRETATVTRACLAAARAEPKLAARLLPVAKECGDFMLWAQAEAGTGVIPFPALRGGRGRPFEVSERYLDRLEKAGLLGATVRKGWVSADPLEDGGLQFDNGLGGCALLELFAVTKDDRYLVGALKAADWAASTPMVPNWNYNSFILQLLAQAYAATRDERYLVAARRKLLFGVQAGQLIEGPRAGRWADAHNARPAYHYIMVRALASLVAVMPEEDAVRPALLDCLRLALRARNPEFASKGIMNVDSSIEALVAVEKLPAAIQAELGPCHVTEALDVLERYAAYGVMKNKPSAGPEACALLLERAARRVK